MSKLNFQDATFLQMDSPRQPFHVAALLILKLPPRVPRSYLRELVHSCAHAMPEDEIDLSFAELGVARRRNTATDENSALEGTPNYADSMARREGFDPPTLRFEESPEDEEDQ